MNETQTRNSSQRVKILIESALCVALSVVLSYFKLLRMPQGGSVTLEMAPLLFLAYRHGFKWGIAAGAMSGLIQLLFGGYVVHPAQAILDYPLAFGCVGIAGLFGEKALLGTIVAGFSRFLCHVVSGAIFFAKYAPEGQNPWIYSIVYNATFIIPALILSAITALILWKRFLDKGVVRETEKPE